MKNLVNTSVIVAFLATVLLFSCKKTETKPTPPSMMGDWKLVSVYGYVDAGNVPPEPKTLYTGTPSDRYNFQSNGKLSWHENNFSSDSATYSLTSRDTVTITYLPKSNPNYSQNVIDTYAITLLTSNKMVLVLDGGPEVEDIITFSR